MYCFGSHVSCAGGLMAAVQRAQELECQCIQIFVSTPRAWPSYAKLIPLRKPTKTEAAKNRDDDLPEEDCSEFTKELKSAGLSAPIAHSTYLINLGSSEAVQWQKSLDALVVEWRRADQLKLNGLVLHPGSFTDATAEVGLENIVRGIRAAEELVSLSMRSCFSKTQQGRAVAWVTTPNSLAICWRVSKAKR